MHRTVYFISDGTGISVETLGHSLMTQFENITFQTTTFRYINTIEKAHQTVAFINQQTSHTASRPIIFSTIADKSIRDQLCLANAFYLDFFQNFISELEKECHTKATRTIGLSHAILDVEYYNNRIEAINYALNNDDGLNLRNYPAADIILIGVSRTGKTPTCLYLAMQFGIQAANYPLTEEDFNQNQLPKPLQAYTQKLFGLTISPERLQTIRTKRKPNSRYASLAQCQFELSKANKLFQQNNIACLNSTHLSVEELATQILSHAHLNNHS